MAPEPSPKRTQLARSVQSSSLLMASAETMSTVSALPAAMKESATSMQYSTPTQAALRSNAGQAAPTASATVQASDGVYVSPRMVAQRMRSTSAPAVPASARAARAEATARSSSRSWVSTRRRRMPVRVKIHSSDVSRNFARSSLVTIFSGIALPVPAMKKLMKTPSRRTKAPPFYHYRRFARTSQALF